MRVQMLFPSLMKHTQLMEFGPTCLPASPPVHPFKTHLRRDEVFPKLKSFLRSWYKQSIYPQKGGG